ncbi:MAG: hypothetical protein WBY94_04390 [Polyangiaceae bacterium]
MTAHLPLPWMLGSSDDAHASPSVRAQTAVVRSLADALEQLAPSSDSAASLRQQLAEELARLGYCIQESESMPAATPVVGR